MDKKNFSFEVIKTDKKCRARLALIRTPHGTINTPAFSPVATKASVKGISSEDLKELDTQVILGNSYHLYLRPGVDIIREFGGFCNFMNWKGPSITDSGGYQVSFLWNGLYPNNSKYPYITDFGIYFKSHIDGTKHFISPKKSMEIQSILGADIIMSFDQPMGKNFTLKENDEAYRRTFKWEEESFKSWQESKCLSVNGNYQALFGIVQGETSKKLRERSLKYILSMDFPGIAMGGSSIGEDPKITSKSLDSLAYLLPNNKPLHALGLGGGPEGVFEAIERGVDIFDNSSVTRMARTGLLFIYPEDGGNYNNKFRINIERNKYTYDVDPISKICICTTCRNYSKAYIRHLLVSKEPLGVCLATIHNIFFYNDLVGKIRKSIQNNDFFNLKKDWFPKRYIE